MDLHTAVATPRALELAGVTGARSFNEGAEIVVRDGHPTGELQEEAAIELVRRLVPRLTEREHYARIAELQRSLAAVGLTGVHAMDGSPATFDLLRELEANGDLLVRSIVPFWIKPETSFEEMEELDAAPRRTGELWRGAVAKFFIDGVIDTGTGWLYEPDTSATARHRSGPIPSATRGRCACSRRRASSAPPMPRATTACGRRSTPTGRPAPRPA